jgi:hypothetical protein
MGYCPNCGFEYRNGYTVCSDCNTELVAEPPEELETKRTLRIWATDFFPTRLEKTENRKRTQAILLILTATLGLYFLYYFFGGIEDFFTGKVWVQSTVIESIGAFFVNTHLFSFDYLLFTMLVLCFAVIVIRSHAPMLVRMIKYSGAFFAFWSLASLVCIDLLLVLNSGNADSTITGQIITINFQYAIYVLIGLLFFVGARKLQGIILAREIEDV